MSEINIYCDGACSGNPGKGGWAAIIVRGNKELIISGNNPYTTNNQMELTAVISALEMLKKEEVATVYSDSKYVVNGITDWIKKWKEKKWVSSSGTRVANQDLWIKLDQLVSELHPKIIWMKGHSSYYIDMADKYAKDQTSV